MPVSSIVFVFALQPLESGRWCPGLGKDLAAAVAIGAA
jgi:hypothetical protein